MAELPEPGSTEPRTAELELDAPASDEAEVRYAVYLGAAYLEAERLVEEADSWAEPGSTDPRGPDGPPVAPRPFPGRAPAAGGGLHPAGPLRVPAPCPGISPGLRHGNAPETSRRAPGEHADRWIQAEAYERLHRSHGAVEGEASVLHFRYAESARGFAEEERARAAHERGAGAYQALIEKMEAEIATRERRIASLEEALRE